MRRGGGLATETAMFLQQLQQLQQAWLAAATEWNSQRAAMEREARAAVLELAVRLGQKVTHRIVKTDPSLIRPAEVEHLIGDSSKARSELCWGPSVDFPGLIRMMVDADLERVAAAPQSADRLSTL